MFLMDIYGIMCFAFASAKLNSKYESVLVIRHNPIAYLSIACTVSEFISG